jgi:hypothetical protein
MPRTKKIFSRVSLGTRAVGSLDLLCGNVLDSYTFLFFHAPTVLFYNYKELLHHFMHVKTILLPYLILWFFSKRC